MPVRHNDLPGIAGYRSSSIGWLGDDPCQHGYMSEESDRSLARIEIAGLLRLAALAADAEAELFRPNPDGSGRYAGRLLGRALCQGLPCAT